jgi:hypothetical protein
MMNRAVNRRQQTDSIIEVPSDETTPLTERLAKIAAEAAKLAVDDYRRSRALQGSDAENSLEARI